MQPSSFMAKILAIKYLHEIKWLQEWMNRSDLDLINFNELYLKKNDI